MQIQQLGYSNKHDKIIHTTNKYDQYKMKFAFLAFPTVSYVIAYKLCITSI